MARITDANMIYAGTEPKFTAEVSQIDLMKSLSWYAQNKDSKDAYKWACDFLKKKHKLDVSSVIKNQSPTFGFVCRIVSNGGVLTTKDQTWLDGEIENLKHSLKNRKQPVVVDEPKSEYL